jgi:hypothetical protein
VTERELEPTADQQPAPRRDAPGTPARRRRNRRAGPPAAAKNQVTAWFARNRLIPVIVLMALAIGGSVLAAGTVHAQVLLCVAPLAIAAGGWAIGRVGRGLRAIPPPAWIAFLLSAYCVLQAIPLPAVLVRGLSPVAANVWVRALEPLGASSQWLSISLDPGASVVEALKWFCYGAMFCAGAAVASGQSRRVVPSIVFASALAAALVALVNRLIGADSLFGLYTPLVHPSFGIAPLINVNNFAGYLNLGAFAGLGLLMAQRPVAPRWAIGLAVSVVLGLSAVCGSRAGLASLAVGMLALVVTLWLVKFDGSRRLVWVPISAFLGGAVFFLLAINAGLWRSMINEGAKKLALISWTKPVVADFPVLGIGRGAFESVFPAYRADEGHHIYQFAENFVMQWCVEWGIPITIATVIGFAYTLRPRRRGARTEVLSLCCGIGALVLLLQNLLDLALEVASVSLALSALLGSVWSERRDERFDTEAPPPLKPRFPPLVFFGVGVLLWTVSAMVGLHTAFDDREAIAALVRARERGDTPASAALGEELHSAMRRHPADPYFPLIAATLAHSQKGAEMAWISRAIERDPMAGRPYLILAQALSRRAAKTQALQAIRLATTHEYALIGPGVTLALALTHDLPELHAAVPEGPAGVGMLVYLSRQGTISAFHEQLLDEAIRRDPLALEPRVVRANDLLAALDAKTAPCDEPRRVGCVDEVRKLVGVIARLDPKGDRAVVFGARLLLSEGNPNAAQKLLAEKCRTLAAQSECAHLRVLAALELNDRDVLADATASLLADSCASQAECATTSTWLGDRLLARGEAVQALRMYERAAQEAETPAAWRRVAEIATQLGMPSVAARALRRVGGDATPSNGSAAEVTRILEQKRLHDLLGASPDAAVP